MGIKKFILHFILSLEMIFISFLKIKKNRITFLSLESDKLEHDFKLIYDGLNHNDYDIQLCLIHYNKNLLGQFMYFINCMKQLYLINTSALVLINDNNYVISHFKRKEVKVLQIWHACGALKKFGNAILREYPIANYDYVISTSSYWKEPYSEAFSLSQDHVLPIGMPRCDQLFNNDYIKKQRESLFQQFPSIKNKKIILYAPTFRGDIYKGFETIPFDSTSLLNQLGEDYVLLYKYHPLLGNIQLDSHPRIYNMNNIDTHALFTITDYLISDYSSIVFDYSILEKPLLFYVPDLKEYETSRGCFVDIQSLQCPVCLTIDEIVKHISDNMDNKGSLYMKDLFFDYKDSYSTKRVCQFINDLLKNEY